MRIMPSSSRPCSADELSNRVIRPPMTQGKQIAQGEAHRAPASRYRAPIRRKFPLRLPITPLGPGGITVAQAVHWDEPR